MDLKKATELLYRKIQKKMEQDILSAEKNVAKKDTPEQKIAFSFSEELPDLLLKQGFLFCQEQKKGLGEDFCLAEYREDQLLIGVFDGCGGSGARIYPKLEGHTGAYVASRAATRAVKRWFRKQKEDQENSLKTCIDAELDICRSFAGAASALKGSLNREFPTTMAMFCLKKQEAEFFWCGDSRGYFLDREGLHQVTVDDVTITDAMQNLREDAPMTNVISASRPYEIHRRKLELKNPGILLVATDGCFGYLTSPMEFERLLLETLQDAGDLKEWKEKLREKIGKVAGDDYTLGLWICGSDSFRHLKGYMKPRLDHMSVVLGADGQTEEKLYEQWECYRRIYESLWQKGQELPDEEAGCGEKEK